MKSKVSEEKQKQISFCGSFLVYALVVFILLCLWIRSDVFRAQDPLWIVGLLFEVTPQSEEYWGHVNTIGVRWHGSTK